MEVESVLVTGANRGIGLEFVKQLVNLPKPPRLVFATYRNRDTVKAIKDIRDATTTSKVILIKMDVTNSGDIEGARKIVDDMVGDKGLTLLINNAGAAKMQPFPETTDENLVFHFATNTLGPINVLKEMLPLLQKSAKANQGSRVGFCRSGVLNISSIGGSILTLDNTEPDEFLAYLGYRISKAALNMAMRVIAIQNKDQGVLVVQMCPGWVKTDMGTDNALLEVNESVSFILDTLPRLDETHHGAFVDNKGVTIPF